MKLIDKASIFTAHDYSYFTVSRFGSNSDE